jgi:biopolymer transport protein ExbD
MLRRRLRKQHAALEITAFLNLIVVLVPFLLSTTVFSRLAVLELSLPPAAAAGVERLQVDRLQLEVILRPDAIEVADRLGGPIARIARSAQPGDDLHELGRLLQQLKQRFPDEQQASVLAEPDTAYERLVQVMGAVRATADVQPLQLFPQLVVGDAPMTAAPRALSARAAQLLPAGVTPAARPLAKAGRT